MKWKEAKILAQKLAEVADLEDSEKRFEAMQVYLLTKRIVMLDPELKRLRGEEFVYDK